MQVHDLQAPIRGDSDLKDTMGAFMGGFEHQRAVFDRGAAILAGLLVGTAASSAWANVTNPNQCPLGTVAVYISPQNYACSPTHGLGPQGSTAEKLEANRGFSRGLNRRTGVGEATYDPSTYGLVGYDTFVGQGTGFFHHLGMYATPDTGPGFALGGGGYTISSSGVGVSDTAGLIAPGSVAPRYRENGGSGGISGSYDASRLVGPNQTLSFTGAFNYTSATQNYGDGAGSISGDAYSFGGTAFYSNKNTYAVVRGAYSFGKERMFIQSDASSGSYDTEGYDVDARIGHVFMLFDNRQAPAPAPRYAKAPAVKPVNDGYAIGLDLSGHLGYRRDLAKGFIDSTGFVFGNAWDQGGDTGVRAKLIAAIPRNGVVWLPYLSATADWAFNYSHKAEFPTVVAGGDTVTFADGTVAFGGQLGLDMRAASGWTVGINGFYSHTSTSEISGGRAYVRIPFGPTSVAARY